MADSLPEPAIAALEAATRDPDPLVAEAARRALASHRAPSLPGGVIQANVSGAEKTTVKPLNLLPLFIICGAISFGLIFCTGTTDYTSAGFPFVPEVMGPIGIILGGCIGSIVWLPFAIYMAIEARRRVR